MSSARMRLGRTALLIAFSSGATAYSNVALERMPVTDFCAVLEQPSSFEGRQIKLNVRVRSDGLEHTWIVDDRCPKKGAAIEYSDKVLDTRGRAKFAKAVYFTPPPGTLDKDIHVTAVGTFVIADDPPQRRFVVDAFLDVRVSPRTDSRDSSPPDRP